ncbi:MAG: diguanylate cyclase [Myxococcota bacterium]|nr:diguanylate cyclase [Myxococcota bacterium]
MPRILLVDDEKVARAVYGDCLIAAGHQVTAVGTIAEAKQALSEQTFDAVVTDLLLPGGDGMEVLQFAKERAAGLEVIVITALDKVAPAVRAIKSGAAEYLVKPVAPETLQHAIHRALTTKQLLRENESLRAHVALLEAGQRISTTLDRERMIASATTAFGQQARASGMVLLARNGGAEPRLVGSGGIAPEIQTQVLAQLEGLSPDAPWPTTLPPPRGHAAARLLAATEGEVTFGWVLLLFAQPPTEADLSAAGYLSSHLALAWRNLDRFAEVEDLAYLDDLTRLFNMRYLHHVLERDIDSARASGTAFSLLFLDLDYFKTINDTHGHLVGSRLLVEVGRVIKGCVRDNDVVCRYGGDEYVVLLRDTDSGGALKVSERIRRTMESHKFLAREGYALSISTCIGVASFPEHAQDKAALLDLADRAMYRGKKSTRNVIYMAARDLEATPASRHSEA